MMPASARDRSPDRSVVVVFRTSPQGREELKAKAANLGVSVQTYLESLAFDLPLGEDRRSGPAPQPQLELPMTG